jgi:hypothetical protein
MIEELTIVYMKKRGTWAITYMIDGAAKEWVLHPTWQEAIKAAIAILNNVADPTDPPWADD